MKRCRFNVLNTYYNSQNARSVYVENIVKLWSIYFQRGDCPDYNRDHKRHRDCYGHICEKNSNHNH